MSPNLSPIARISQTFVVMGMLSSFCFCDAATAQSYLDSIGYTQLRELVGPSLATGAGLDVALIEPGASYRPDLNNSALSTKSIVDQSNVSNGISGHSTGSAIRLFGSTGVAPGVDNVNVYQAEDWLTNHIRYLSTSDPTAQNFHVTSHSYIIPAQNGSATDPEDVALGQLTTAAITDLLTRVDHVIQRDNTSTFVGTNNGNSTVLPAGLTPAYNAIAVGRSDGNHAAGQTTFYGAGRTKVDIVAPLGSSSAATPVAAAAGALLIDSAGIGTDASRNQIIKATLLAGATKSEFSAWDRTTTRPLDERFGAGELNILNSYQIQQAGQQEGSNIDGQAIVSTSGWDYVENFNPLGDRFYNFDVVENTALENLSIILSWNLNVTDTSPGQSVFTPVTSLTNFDLTLSDSDGNLVDQSLSTVDNVEHLFLSELESGTYSLRVSGDGIDDFGLAWRGSVVSLAPTGVPEPGSFSVLALLACLTLASRRKS